MLRGSLLLLPSDKVLGKSRVVQDLGNCLFSKKVLLNELGEKVFRDLVRREALFGETQGSHFRVL